MNVTRKDTGDLTATLTVEVEKNDFQDNVNKVLSDYRKKANIPGFRQGKVPMGMVKRMYGQAATLEEVNKVISESLSKYITEEKLNLLGNPLPTTELDPDQSWENQDVFTFDFDIALSPVLDVKIDKRTSINYHVIKVDDEMVNKQIDSMRKRYGNHVEAEEISEGDVAMGAIVELDAEGNELEGGINNQTTSISIDYIKDEAIRNQFIGIKKEEEIVFDAAQATQNITELSSMLGINAQEAENVKSNFRFTVKHINRIVPAELNEEFFGKLQLQDKVENEEQLKESIKKDIASGLSRESDMKFHNDVMLRLMDKTEINLPDEFMKRWLLTSNEGKLTREQIEAEYEGFQKSMKWQLLQGHLVKENDIKVEANDIIDYVKDYFKKQMPFLNEDEESQKRLNDIAAQVLKNNEEAQKIQEQLYETRLIELFKDKFKVTDVELTYDEFVKMVSEPTNK